MKIRPIPAQVDGDDQLPDGVYIGLPESRYFAQRALGSSDLSSLWADGDGFWWKSRHNPFFVRKRSDPLDFGSGLHCKVLEGPEAFAARYFVAPNPLDFPGLLVTQPQIYSALRESPAPKVSPKSKKTDLIEMAKAYLPDRPIWDVIEERAQRQAQGRTVIGAEAAWQLDIMLEAAMSDPTLRAAATAEGGVRLVEVSVFWTLPSGTRLRFRFDSLLPAANCDLKSIDNYRQGDQLEDAIGKAIGSRSMDIQAALSFTARRAAYAAIEADQVWVDPEPVIGDPEEQLAWIRRFPGEAPLDLDGKPGWRWLWIFFQKPDNAGRAPTIVPVWMEFGGLEHRDGYRKAAHALAFYEQKVATVGLETPWTAVKPAHHLDATAAPELQIRIPSWTRQPMAVADEEEALQWQTT